MESWELVRFLHILALALFVGGQIMLVVAIVPVLRGQPEDVMLGVARRFGIASAVAIVVLLATGIAMASHYSRWEDETLQAKLAVLVLVAVLTGLHIASPRSRAVALGSRRPRCSRSGSAWSSRTRGATETVGSRP